VTYNPDFKVTIIQRQITRKRYNTELYLQWLTNRKSYMFYTERRHFQWPWTIPTPGFKVTPFWRSVSQKRYEIQTFNGILIGTYTRPTQQCHLKCL